MFLIKTIITFLKDNQYRDLVFTTLFIVALGTLMYHRLEVWDWLDSLYFSVITLATVGYGDFSPQTTGGKIFTIFYVIIGIGIILSFANAFYAHYITVVEKGLEERRERRNRNKED